MKDHLTKYRPYFVHALLAVALIALPSTFAPAAPAPPEPRSDQLIVKPKPGRDLSELHARARGLLKKKVKDAQTEFDVVKLPPGLAIADALAHYRSSPEVEYAEPDYILSARAVPNDPHYADATLWALHNTGQSGGLNDADIDAPEAWDLRSSAPNIIVAVVDTGVRFTHEDLAPNMWRNPGEVAANGLDDDHNGYVDDLHGISALDATGYPMDGHGHGTHVAGTIAASGNNGLGIVGIAWRAEIMALKFLDGKGDGYTSDAVISIDYARAKGASVVNASFAGPGNSITLRDAILRARSAGIIIVAAAGNESVNNDAIPSYPANYAIDNVVSVAATTRTDALASFSNYGAQTVHLAAPGASIYSTYHTADNAYVVMSGTSMAAPHVAGAIALMRAHASSESYRQSIERVLNGVDRLPALTAFCTTGGRLNLHRALQGGSSTNNPNPNPITLVLLPGQNPGQLRLRISGSYGQRCAIERSTNFTSWLQYSFLTLPMNGLADLTVDTTATPRAYYRVRQY